MELYDQQALDIFVAPRGRWLSPTQEPTGWQWEVASLLTDMREP